MADVNYEDVFTNAPQQTEEERKAAWAERRKEERAKAYSLIDETAMSVAGDPDMMMKYLNVQSQFDRYSTANALLITAQRPSATRLEDFNRWKANGAFIKRNEKGIVILEPGSEYSREDGSVGIHYNVKRVFDIAQTNAKLNPSTPKPGLGAVLKALVQASPVPIRVVDTPVDSQIASYLPEENAIAVAKNQEAVSLVQCISQEIAYAALVTSGHPLPVDPDVLSYCASYMVCRKFGVSTQDYSFAAVCRGLDGLDGKNVRNALNEMRTAGTDIIGRMKYALDRAQNTAPREAVR